MGKETTITLKELDDYMNRKPDLEGKTRKIYFYADEEYPEGTIHAYDSVSKAIYDSDQAEIHTTDLAHLSFGLIDIGFDIYVVRNGITLQFYPGMDCCVGKDIRYGHNILRLFMGGLFNDDFKK